MKRRPFTLKRNLNMTPKKPAYEIRLGNIRATIWPNQSENRTWYSVAITRRYKQGKETKDATNFSRDDLPLVAQVAVMACSWICKRQASESDSKQDAA